MSRSGMSTRTPLSAELFTNRFFKFVIGSGKRETIVHADVFAELSRAMNVLINGPFSEAADQSVVWEDVSVQTFDRLVQFAYCGDYTPVRPRPLNSLVAFPGNGSHSDDEREYDLGSESSPQSPSLENIRLPREDRHPWRLPYCVEEHLRDHERGQTNLTRRKRTFSRFSTGMISNARTEVARQIRQQYAASKQLIPSHISTPECDEDNEPYQNYRDMLFCHAELYVLADKYGIDELAAITTHNLFFSLYSLTIFEGSTYDIADLTRYIFQNTRPNDPIQIFLIRLAVVIIEDVYETVTFSELVQDIPGFALGLVQQLTMRFARVDRTPMTRHEV
ncbi:hypothetical protein F4677DRAFT_183855 [Hypoxylon crocopeplum]|nr:hypothetical protein F4677DRAFT_183855 [Hypoxylon crocopeplum]